MNIKTVAMRRENMLWFRAPEKVYFKKGCLPVALDELTECVPDPNSVEQMVDGRILVDKLNVFLEGLPVEARKIFMRRYWEVCSIQEIAEIYGISESKVKVSLFRTRGKLKTFLEKEGIVL